MARWAEAPKPNSPTRSPGSTPATRRLRKPMIPAQSSGAACTSSSAGGSGKTKSARAGGEPGVPAIDRVAGECRRVAEILRAAAAVGTRAVGAADPRDSHPRADRKGGSGAGGDLAHNLVSGNQRAEARRQLAFHDVEVGAADAAGAHANHNLVGRGFRTRHLADLEGPAFNRAGRTKNGGAHRPSSSR